MSRKSQTKHNTQSPCRFRITIQVVLLHRCSPAYPRVQNLCCAVSARCPPTRSKFKNPSCAASVRCPLTRFKFKNPRCAVSAGSRLTRFKFKNFWSAISARCFTTRFKVKNPRCAVCLRCLQTLENMLQSLPIEEEYKSGCGECDNANHNSNDLTRPKFALWG